MIKTFSLFLVFFTLLTGLLSCSGSNNKVSEKIVVKVDQLELKASDFSERLALKLKSFDALTAKDMSVFNRAKSEVIDEFILEALSMKWAQEKGLQLKNSVVKEELGKVKAAYPDELSFKRALAAEGLTQELWLKKFRMTLLQKVILDELAAKMEPPTKEEIKAYYQSHPSEFRKKDQLKVRQIVLKTENNANRIVKELKSGKKFEDLAKKFSLTPEAVDGGLVGWVDRGSVEVFDEAYKNGGTGLSSKIIKSSFGFHIVEILNITRGGVISLSDKGVEESIVEKLMAEKKQKAFSNWLEAELRKSRVYKNEGLIQAIYAETKG